MAVWAGEARAFSTRDISEVASRLQQALKVRR
jgi:hypothetical protein